MKIKHFQNLFQIYLAFYQNIFSLKNAAKMNFNCYKDFSEIRDFQLIEFTFFHVRK